MGREEFENAPYNGGEKRMMPGQIEPTICFNNFLHNLGFVDVAVIKDEDALGLWKGVHAW